MFYIQAEKEKAQSKNKKFLYLNNLSNPTNMQFQCLFKGYLEICMIAILNVVYVYENHRCKKGWNAGTMFPEII